jgi:predicted dehydrogenase
MLKVAIIGCGKIADAHAAQIQRIEGCEIVAVCDREPLMAKQLYDRFPVRQYFTDVAEMLSEARPDVVHITTSPESHFDIARLCMENGSHVYVEKPFTIDAEQAQTLLNLAEQKSVKLTVGHNEQFSHVACRMRSMIRDGYLGGPPVHMESYHGYDLGDSNYARALLADKKHWVRRLPGQLLQNLISHGTARVAEFLTSDAPQVIAYGFVSPRLKSIGEYEIIDELRVIICEEERTTAYFTFSTQMKPLIHEFRIFGPKNGLALDQDHEILLKLRGRKFKSYADKFVPPLQFAKQHIGNLIENGRLFLNRDFHVDSSMRNLIQAFYLSIREDAPLPISYKEILRTARIMDSIFEQVYSNRSSSRLSLETVTAWPGLVAPRTEPR